MLTPLRDIWETGQLFLLLTLGAAILFALHRFFGWRGVAAGVLAMLGLALYRKGRTDGRTHIIEKEAEHADEVVRTADDARSDARRRDADPDKLRDDDGFKRRT